MYPIYFKDNRCIECGSDRIKTLDINNEPIPSDTNRDIRRVVCCNCGTKYILHWNNDSFYPMVDKDYNILKFLNNFNNK